MTETWPPEGLLEGNDLIKQGRVYSTELLARLPVHESCNFRLSFSDSIAVFLFSYVELS